MSYINMKVYKDELKVYKEFLKLFVGDDGIIYFCKWLEDLDIVGWEVLGWYEVVDNIIMLGVNECVVKLFLVFIGISIE